MTTVWDEIGDVAGEKLRDQLLAMVRHADSNHGRTQQRHLGPSEIGDPCSHCLAAKILGVYERDEFYDPWPAIIGTSVHKWLERAAERDNRDNGATWSTETKVLPDDELLPKGGSADLYDDVTGTVIDHKVVGLPALKKYKANGPGVTYRRQAHLYGLGFVNANLPVNRVAIAFWHRGGRMTDLYVWTEDYSEAYAREALDRYRTLRELCATAGTAILPSLPSDPDCYTCSRSNKATAQPNKEKTTMSDSIWDDPELKSNDDYIKFDQVGDTVTGKILAVKKHVFDDGKVVPQILMDVNGEERTLTAGQIRLKAELAEKRPGVGDILTVTLSDIEKRSGGKTLKHFTVIIGGAGQSATPAPATPEPAATITDPAAAAAAIAALTPEQKVALGIAV